jgi:DNA-binding transcriptional MerR regulator
MRIGELAGLVGISTRAIRHYHRVGLLAEPARTANGYREYSLRDAVELARVRRLTELGLSLDEVGDTLADDAGRDLVEILRELDVDLACQEADLRRRRARLAQLLRQAETGGKPSEQAPVSPGLAGLFPDGDLEETGFGAAFYADFAPAQAAAIRRAIDLMRESQANRQETTS